MQEALLADAADPANDAQVALRDALPAIVQPINAPIILPCGDFSSALTDSTTDSFNVQIINCPMNAIARCIAWIVHPETGTVVNAVDLQNKANFWSYSNRGNVKHGVTAPIIVKDANGGSCQRVIRFRNLPINPKPEWDVRCSYTGAIGVCIFIFNDIFNELIHIVMESLKYIELSQHYNKFEMHSQLIKLIQPTPIKLN